MNPNKDRFFDPTFDKLGDSPEARPMPAKWTAIDGAQVRDEHGFFVADCNSNIPARRKADADNAALIAAAPELLSALEEILEGAIPHKRDFLMTKYALLKARSALARAKGGAL